MKIKGVRAPDELTGPNKGKIRLLPRADEKGYNKGKRNGSRHRAERVAITHEMTTEEARNTELSTTRTERGRYGNAHHIRYDINDGLVDVILEVTPTEEQRAERARGQKDHKGKRRMTKEREHEIKNKGEIQTKTRRRRMRCMHVARPHKENVVRTARAKCR
jgi:hypothetical protein